MPLRSQSALEFMTTYSFAFVMISLAILVGALIVSVQGSNLQLFSSCSIEPLLQCEQTLLSYNSNSVSPATTYILLFRNQINFVMKFPANAINLTVTNIGQDGKHSTFGSCSPTYAPSGSQVVCTVTLSGANVPRFGTNVFTPFSLNYTLCQSQSTCYGGNYNATGYSSETLGPSTTSLYNFTITSNNGIVIIGGSEYFGGSTVYLASGNYIIYAQPNPGHHFVSWSWTGGSSSRISPTGSQNSVLVLKSNGNVIATFS